VSAQLYLSRSVQWCAAGRRAPASTLHTAPLEQAELELASARLWYLPCRGLSSGQGVWLSAPRSIPVLASSRGASSCIFFQCLSKSEVQRQSWAVRTVRWLLAHPGAVVAGVHSSTVSCCWPGPPSAASLSFLLESRTPAAIWHLLCSQQ